MSNRNERLQEHMAATRQDTGEALRLRALESRALDLTSQAKRATGSKQVALTQEAMATYQRLFEAGRRR